MSLFLIIVSFFLFTTIQNATTDYSLCWNNSPNHPPPLSSKRVWTRKLSLNPLVIVNKNLLSELSPCINQLIGMLELTNYLLYHPELLKRFCPYGINPQRSLSGTRFSNSSSSKNPLYFVWISTHSTIYFLLHLLL